MFPVVLTNCVFLFPDQFSEEGDDGKVGTSPRKLPKLGETGTRDDTEFAAGAVII